MQPFYAQSDLIDFEPLAAEPHDILYANDCPNGPDIASAVFRSRVEKVAQDYLKHRHPLISTTALRGPFDANWLNPWTQRQEPAERIAPLKRYQDFAEASAAGRARRREQRAAPQSCSTRPASVRRPNSSSSTASSRPGSSREKRREIAGQWFRPLPRPVLNSKHPGRNVQIPKQERYESQDRPLTSTMGDEAAASSLPTPSDTESDLGHRCASFGAINATRAQTGEQTRQPGQAEDPSHELACTGCGCAESSRWHRDKDTCVCEGCHRRQLRETKRARSPQDHDAKFTTLSLADTARDNDALLNRTTALGPGGPFNKDYLVPLVATKDTAADVPAADSPGQGSADDVAVDRLAGCENPVETIGENLPKPVNGPSDGEVLLELRPAQDQASGFDLPSPGAEASLLHMREANPPFRRLKHDRVLQRMWPDGLAAAEWRINRQVVALRGGTSDVLLPFLSYPEALGQAERARHSRVALARSESPLPRRAHPKKRKATGGSASRSSRGGRTRTSTQAPRTSARRPRFVNFDTPDSSSAGAGEPGRITRSSLRAARERATSTQAALNSAHDALRRMMTDPRGSSPPGAKTVPTSLLTGGGEDDAAPPSQSYLITPFSKMRGLAGDRDKENEPETPAAMVSTQALLGAVPRWSDASGSCAGKARQDSSGSSPGNTPGSPSAGRLGKGITGLAGLAGTDGVDVDPIFDRADQMLEAWDMELSLSHCAQRP